jgi:hypothetical protein
MKLIKIASYVCVLLALSFTSSRAQKVEIEWGKEIKSDKYTTLGSVIGKDDNSYYILKSKKRGGFLSFKFDMLFEQYDHTHSLLRSKVLNLKVDNKECDYEGIYQLKDKFVMFLSRYDSKADMQLLYAVNIDKDGTQERAEVVDKIPVKKASKVGSYSFVISEDASKILVFRADAYDKKGTEKFKYKMITSSLEVLWEKDIELPYKDKNFEINEYMIDETGNVFLLGSFKMKKGDDYSQFKIFAYDFKKEKLEEINVNFTKAKYISNLKFFYNKGALHLTGFFYTEKGGVAGIFYNRINAKTFSVEQERNTAFDKKTLTKFISERKVKKGKGLSANMKIRNIIVAEDETIRLVAEDYYVHIVTTTDPKTGATRTTYHYYNNEIFVIKLSKDGEINWCSRVPKRQYSVNDNATYASYLLAFDKDNIYLLYNDNPANGAPKKKPDAEPKVVKLNKVHKATIMLASVDKDGNMTQEIYYKSKEKSKSYFVPSSYSRLSNEKIWISGMKGKYFKYGFLILKS